MTEEVTEIDIVQKYLNDITTATGGDDCLYRGQKNANWELKSGADRRLGQGLPKDAIVQTDIMADYHKTLIKKSKKLGFGFVEGRPLDDLEILTKLQHFEAATALLDFTTNPLVALYFACASDGDKNGQLFILRRKRLQEVEGDEDIKPLIEDERAKTWTPVMDGTAERRIIRQHSVFVLASVGALKKTSSDSSKPDGDIEPITIYENEKTDILTVLKNNYQISAETLFIDLQGFAANNAAEEPYGPYLTAFSRGSAESDEDDLSGTIDDSDNVTDIKPDSAEAYINRGNAKWVKGDFDGAIEDYTEAIRLKPDLVGAYFNLGNAKGEKGDIDGAIADYTQAIRFKPDYADAYYNRGIAKSKKGDNDGAIEDYTCATDIKSGYVNAYYNRGLIKVGKGDFFGAKEDFGKALFFATEQKNVALVTLSQQALANLGGR